jgi:guanosine-3',5'-bis(diphosphate) 3'-pyrophosphohydrolase
MEGSSVALVLRAAAFAAEKHRAQRRKDADASPYINHPLALANVLANLGGVTDAEVLCAALLHDTVEDTMTTEAELRAHFGAAIAGIVMEVTDDRSLPKSVRKQAQIDHASGCSHGAKLVKVADKVCNLQDLLDSPPKSWPPERKRAYFDWASRVVAGMRGTNAAIERRFDELLAQGRVFNAPDARS